MRAKRFFVLRRYPIYKTRIRGRILSNPYIYLFICILLVAALGRMYYLRTAKNLAEPERINENPDWQKVWTEMNKKSQYEPAAINEKETIEYEYIKETDAISHEIKPGVEILPKMQLCIENLGFTMENLCDFDYLFNRFYTLNSGTSVTAELLDVRSLLSKDLSIKGDNSKPQILIYHTHSQESYADSRPGYEEDTIVGVGNLLTDILTEEYGFNVLHHKGVYDMTDGRLDRDMAYERARPEIEKLLEENPSIEVVIDLHRDGVREDVHLLTEIDGKHTAKIMFFNGVCRDENGEIKDLPNPYVADNLSFSLQMRLASMLVSGDFCRTNYLKTWRYNQQFMERCILVEVGAQTNTVEEAKNAMEPLAKAVSFVLSE